MRGERKPNITMSQMRVQISGNPSMNYVIVCQELSRVTQRVLRLTRPIVLPWVTIELSLRHEITMTLSADRVIHERLFSRYISAFEIIKA